MVTPRECGAEINLHRTRARQARRSRGPPSPRQRHDLALSYLRLRRGAVVASVRLARALCLARPDLFRRHRCDGSDLGSRGVVRAETRAAVLVAPSSAWPLCRQGGPFM